jgi:hypothetical protein
MTQETIMVPRTMKLALRALLVVGAFAAAGPAGAQVGISGYSGKLFGESNPSYVDRDLACITENWGALQNNCSVTVDIQWTLPLTLTTSGSYRTIFVYASTYSPSSSSLVACNAVSRESDGRSTVDNETLTYQAAGDRIVSHGLTVSNQGSVFVNCYVPPGGKVYSLYYQ